jgi:hypothetical protein
MITLGIDLASQPEKTALCAIEWTGPPVIRVLCRGKYEGTKLHDKFLITAMRGLRFDFGGVPISKTAIDAPFGWPEPFLEAVVAHQHGDGWPSGMDNPRAPFERRATDRFVHRRAKKTPLSVSADKIASPAMRCAVLLADLRYHHGPEAVDRSGSGMVCEAYPDPALRRWTGDHRVELGLRESYKGPECSARRGELTEVVTERSGLLDPDRLLDGCVDEDDYLDALVCAFVARATCLRRTLPPDDADEERLAHLEGWIHLPDCELDELRST